MSCITWCGAASCVNFVAHFDSDAWTEESWTHECDRAELMQTYAALA